MPEQESGLPGFPAISNYWNHLRIQVSSEEYAQHPGDGQYALKVTGLLNGDRYEAEAMRRSLPLCTFWLKGIWHDTPVRQGSILRFIAPHRIDKSKPVYEISDEHGLVVVEPETLISATTLAQALWCPRRALLQERFRSLAPPALPLTLGTVVHELFQAALRERPSPVTKEWLLTWFHDALLPQIETDLTSLNISVREFEEKLNPYLQNVCDWISEHYPARKFATLINGQGNAKRGPATLIKKLSFDQVVDIEESIWTPTIGVKGRIDVSFKGRTPSQQSTMEKMLSRNQRLPLELKTGKSYDLSIEHQTQVLLYALMLSERGNDGFILPGLVLYLKDNSMTEILPRATELRGLLHLRNRLAAHLHVVSFEAHPPPLESPRFCSSCPYALTCAFVDKCEATRHNGHVERQTSKEMQNFLDAQLAHLGEERLTTAITQLEAVFEEWNHAKKRGTNERLFKLPPEEREKLGSCTAGLRLESWKELSGSVKGSIYYRLRFTREACLTVQFEHGDLVTVSSGRAYALVIGTVESMEEFSITIASERRPPDEQHPGPIGRKRGANETKLYHVDRLERFNNFYDRVAVLMEGLLAPNQSVDPKSDA